MSSTPRYVQNHASDKIDDEHDLLQLDSGRLPAKWSKQFSEHIVSLMSDLTANFKLDFNDSVYSGNAGIALLHIRMADADLVGGKLPLTDRELLLRAERIIDKTLCDLDGKKSQKDHISFLHGLPGLWTLKAIISSRLNNLCNNIYLRYITMVEFFVEKVCDENDLTKFPDEILFGRAGLLYALLLLRATTIPDSRKKLTDDRIRKLVQVILKSGIETARIAKSHRENYPPLVYYWHDKEYIGAAHGYAGILYTLLEARDYLSGEQLETLIRPTVDYICRLQFESSGNFPSTGRSLEDRLQQWCHGAPGVVYMLVAAYQVFQDSAYLQAARKAANGIWKRGLLTKGFGLCHGVAGNGYAFLRLYQLLGETKYLIRAIQFASWCCSDEGRTSLVRTPDRPYSMFEGSAGVICFLADMLKPIEARFPGFQLDYLESKDLTKWK